MTMWQPDLTDIPGPRYRAIADALAGDLGAGRLRPGDRLPTHRDLAWALKVTVGTVSRAYAEAERRGLIAGEVGRGTYIRAPETVPVPPPDLAAAGPINMARAQAIPGDEAALLGESLRRIAAEADLADLLRYGSHAGGTRGRAAAAQWFGRCGVPASQDRVVITVGGQHAIACTLGALVAPGDTVAAEAMTYPGFKAAAKLRHLKVEGIAVDAEGIMPEALAAACRHGAIRLLYLTPNLSNPLGGILSLDRRRAVVEIARQHDVMLLEDDVFGFLNDRLPALAALAPERTVLMTSLSKLVAGGLRIGYVLAPSARIAEQIGGAVHGSVWMAPPLMVEIATRWLNDGAAERLGAVKRQEAARRQALVRRMLPSAWAAAPAAYHAWLPLPETWRPGDFAAAALERGVEITPGQSFSITRTPPLNGVRFCTSPSAEIATVERGLGVLADLLSEEPDAGLSVV